MALVSTRSGRRYSTRKPLPEPGDYGGPTTPFDDRARLPLEDRLVRREVLPNGTVVISYQDPPPGSLDNDDGEDGPPLPEAPDGDSPEELARKLDRKRGLR